MKPPVLPEMQLIPIDEKKRPTVREWQKTSTTYSFAKAHGVGLVTGAISGNVEAVDVDVKYDLTGTLFQDLKRAIAKAQPGLLEKMTVQRTRSGGYHLIYRCAELEGNLKLARRPTTAEEREITRQNQLQHFEAAGDPEAQAKADKAAGNDNVRVLIETRGEGGYIAIAPTPGYEVVYGALDRIQEITVAERSTLLAVCRTFHEAVEVFQPPKPKKAPAVAPEGLTPFDDYNSRADVLTLLERHGWSQVGHKGAKVLLKRPGSTDAAHSGNWDVNRNWFTVFSTSTAFEPEKAYLPSAVYAILEHGGDFNAAASALYQQGYGERLKPQEKVSSSSREKLDKPKREGLWFVATEEDYSSYHQSLRDGTFREWPGFGLSRGDHFLRLKDGDLYLTNGIDNVGKSTVAWWLMALASVLYGKRWFVFSAENTVGGFVRKIMEFYMMKKLAIFTDQEYEEAHAWMKKHFTMIRADEELYSLEELMQMVDEAQETLGKHDGLLIDPYNALRLDVPPGSKNSTHEQHYEVITRLKLWARIRSLTTFVNTHAITEASRRVDEKGYIKPPLKGDVEGGQKFANKADQFITIHRVTQHPDLWMWTELHIRKVKETETGGRGTPQDEPILIRMTPDGTGFIEEDAMGRERNPMQVARFGEQQREWVTEAIYPDGSWEVLSPPSGRQADLF